MTEIRKITGIVPTNKAAVEAAFAGIEPQAVACCNWPEQFPYTPEVSFRMFHTGDYLMLRFDVAERCSPNTKETTAGRSCWPFPRRRCSCTS